MAKAGKLDWAAFGFSVIALLAAILLFTCSCAPARPTSDIDWRPAMLETDNKARVADCRCCRYLPLKEERDHE